MRTRTPLRAALLVTALTLAACGTAAGGSSPAPLTPSRTGGTLEYVQPPFVELPPDAPDRPGDDHLDWRRQVRESIQRHPGTFVVPAELPADVDMAFTSPWWGHPVLDVMSAGSGVIVCADAEAACASAVGDAPVVVVRSGVVDGQPFHVLLKPTAQPGTTGQLSAEQQGYWATVAFTAAVPDWAGVPAPA